MNVNMHNSDSPWNELEHNGRQSNTMTIKNKSIYWSTGQGKYTEVCRMSQRDWSLQSRGYSRLPCGLGIAVICIDLWCCVLFTVLFIAFLPFPRPAYPPTSWFVSQRSDRRCLVPTVALYHLCLIGPCGHVANVITKLEPCAKAMLHWAPALIGLLVSHHQCC